VDITQLMFKNVSEYIQGELLGTSYDATPMCCFKKGHMCVCERKAKQEA